MSENVEDLTQYLPRGGWMTTTIPMTFNINDVARFEKKFFLFEHEDPAYMIHVTFQHGDSIDFTYYDKDMRDEDFEMLTNELRRSKFKVLNGKPGPKANRKD